MIVSDISLPHVAGIALTCVGSTMVYACAVKGSWRLTLAGIAIGTVGAVLILWHPTVFK